MKEPKNQEDERQREEAKESLGVGKGDGKMKHPVDMCIMACPGNWSNMVKHGVMY